MSTLVCFHAHPDDEATSTGGLMAKAAAAGHRVILVTATNGELGEPTPGVLAPGERLAERRIEEVRLSAKALGAEEPRLLGYHDSGMVGEPTNDDPACFWRADVGEAAERLAGLLDDVSVDVLTIYDDHGLYGHPDHIQVHRVGLAVAGLLGIRHVYEATISRELARDSFRRLSEEAAASGEPPAPEQGPPPEEFYDQFGLPHAQLAYSVDVTGHVEAKRAAMRAHRSQIADDSWFLSVPDGVFAEFFGTEWYAVPGGGGDGPTPVDLLPGL